MKQFENKEAAFASQNFDPSAVEMQGVPAHMVDAVKGFINRMVVTDAVNEGFYPDYEDFSQDKWETFYKLGSPSGAGFSLIDHVIWWSLSNVGARLVSESRNAATHVDELCRADIIAMTVYDRRAYEESKK